MTNFDFLKNFNNELYEIGSKLEEDVLNSPRAVTADATLFLENLVKDIYRISHKKLGKNLISFYKKIDSLYRSGVISYIYKNKLQDAYNLRNTIHKKNLDSAEEKKLALDLHKRLYYISRKYFRDFCENERYIEVPDYRPPSETEIHFDNCIICGYSNKASPSNMCQSCNQKIENANFMLSIEDKFKDMPFTRQDLVELGINESRAILFLMDLSKHNAVLNNGDYYTLNPENFKGFIDEVNQYVRIGLLITQFYKDEITADEIKKTDEYANGMENKFPYREFYRLVNLKIERTFERNLLKTRNIHKSMNASSMDDSNIKHWYYHEREAFLDGILNDAFILYNRLLINDFFKLKKMHHEDDETIMQRLNISDEVYGFWQSHFMAGRFTKKTRNIKRNVIIRELRKNRTLNQALNAAKVSKSDFEKMYNISKENDDEFYREFEREYVQKRQRIVIRHLKNHNLNKAVKLSKISKNEFLRWYYEGEKTLSDFYVQSTEILMEKYLSYRKNDWDKKDILKEINVSRDMFNSWSRHDEFKLFSDFENRNHDITSSLVKRGKIINGIKAGRSKQEAIFYANLTPREFVEMYNNSKREKTEFYLRFDVEYEKSRKRMFSGIIREDDFYNAIQKCEISQKEFNNWYSKDQDRFLSSNKASGFYMTTTCELMDKYLKARLNGKNKPDAAKSVGLSNTTISKWLSHPEFDLFYDFKKRYKQLTIDLIVDGFSQGKSKIEVSELCDISLKTIDEYIELGRNGFGKYEKLVDLYESNVIPAHLEIFLKDIQSKNYYKSLKHAKLSRQELEYYYGLGRSGDEKFTDFYKDFLDIKIELYVSSILSKKSSKIALKNSLLSDGEFDENINIINDMILERRMSIMLEGLLKPKTTGVKLAKAAGISVDELYDWYFRGKGGDEKYEEFAQIFEMVFILPRVMVMNKGKTMGIDRKVLLKRLKKDIGSADFKIWQENDVLNMEMSCININDDDAIDAEKVIRMLRKSKLFNVKSIDEDSNSFKLIKKSFKDKSNALFNVSVIDKSKFEEAIVR